MGTVQGNLIPVEINNNKQCQLTVYNLAHCCTWHASASGVKRAYAIKQRKWKGEDRLA